jgi:hypothetical protein
MIWKALLGLGETDFAEKVARTALEVFTRNEKKHAMCFENYIIRDGEGSGVVHMSALTAPVINFYCAYFRPGQVSTGFDARLVKRKDRDGKISLFFESPFLDKHVEGAVIVLEPSTVYRVNGTEIKSTESGSLSFLFEIDKEAVVTIKKAGL